MYHDGITDISPVGISDSGLRAHPKPTTTSQHYE